MFENTFKKIDDILRKDDGCGNELDYVEQSSWILFLKYLDDLEIARAIDSELSNKSYTPIISEKFRWAKWAAPKTAEGKPDYNRAMTGDDLMDFVRLELFPYLKKFKETAAGTPNSIQYKIGEIFGEIHCKIAGGYVLRDILWAVDDLKFQTSDEKHEMSHLYESRIGRMGNAGRNGGEYYTPRPLIRTMVKLIDPEIGKTVYDGACGSAGFLCEAFAYMQEKAKTIKQRQILQESTFYGKEKKILPYIVGTMNMILHGVEAPNILHTNTLKENLADVQAGDCYDFILANPPFGGAEVEEVKQNFLLKSGETAYLFLQHFIKHLRPGGRAGIVIKNTFLSNGDAISLRRELLESCNLYAVLDLPQKVFSAGVKTVVLFFEKGIPTEKIWYYQLNLDRNLGKTNPINESDLAPFVELFADKKESENSWSVCVGDLDNETLDLSVKNPHRQEEVIQRTPEKIATEIKTLNQQNDTLLVEIMALVK